MRSISIVIIALILAAISMSFFMLNDQVVPLDLYFDAFPEARLPIVILSAFVIGVVVGCMATLGLVLSHKREIRRLRKIQKETEEELTNLRNLPLKDDGIGSGLADYS
ncbi:MAG: LapA family protein [Gammaproteobacteria bacterium]|nr:MAG: LapA family protein [Gammaproteobacteria bacterium]